MSYQYTERYGVVRVGGKEEGEVHCYMLLANWCRGRLEQGERSRVIYVGARVLLG